MPTPTDINNPAAPAQASAHAPADQQLCFVVMGYGKKTHFETGRTLDLDATYQAIIKPAVLGQGMRCVRSDEILQSGIIDVGMYELLLRADLVIADISTDNVNAVYELGVRHALRPYATIIMKESEGKLHFDLNHISTFSYKHLGEDIGAREAERARTALGQLIAEVVQSPKPDSPVYRFLPTLQHPRLTDTQFEALVAEKDNEENHVASLLRKGEEAIKASRFEEAVTALTAAKKMKPADSHIARRLTLATYKSESPTALEALLAALDIIRTLNPDQSNDPETLGLTGAIYKRLWQQTSQPSHLDAAIRYYKRGYDLRQDYYNGENLASCYDEHANLHADPMEIQYDRMSARKVRESIHRSLTELVSTDDHLERSDRKWVYATLANTSFALSRPEEAEKYEELFFLESSADWEHNSYHNGKQVALAAAKMQG